MAHSTIDQQTVEHFQSLLGEARTLHSGEALKDYGHDETEDLQFDPDIVLLPETTAEVSQIMHYCYKNNIPVTPRGGGTGLSGGALPVKGGVILSIERMNEIKKIDTANFQAITQSGVITQVFQEAVEEEGLFYPPDPASRGSCLLGGNIAENSGGPKAVKYGVVQDYVLNLEVVLPDGAVIWTGANVLKNATGYNLTQLMVGSEGTLGIVTKIVFKLIPQPKHDLLLLVPFPSAQKACEAVTHIMRSGITPSGLEFMERDAIDWTLDYLEDVNLPVSDEVQAHLLIEVDGNNKDLLFEECEKITDIVEQHDCTEVLFADTDKKKADLWRLRKNVAEAVKSRSIYKEEDTVVPRRSFPELLKGVKEIEKKYGFKTVCYGHAGDGNLHVNIVKGDLSESDWNKKLPRAIREIFKLCHSLGGTISGEHGIGYVQKDYLDIVFNERSLYLQQQIKKLFDPKGILNPGKIFADQYTSSSPSSVHFDSDN